MEEQHLLKCPKCGALMFQEGYLKYGWYLDGERVECCPRETPGRGKLPRGGKPPRKGAAAGGSRRRSRGMGDARTR